MVKPHGVRGEVALEIWGEVGETLRPGVAVQMGRRTTEVMSLRGAGDHILARLDGVEDRNAAEDVRGLVLSVPSEGLPLPLDGEEYLFELEGCVVEVEQDEAVSELGTVRRVIEDGGGLLLEVVGSRENGEVGAEPSIFLVPYVSAYLLSKDLARGVLRFALPEGLLDTCVSTS